MVVDSREQKNKHIIDYFDSKGISWCKEKLDWGDYTIKTNCFNSCREFHLQDICTIERKANLEELSGNLAHERTRIEAEFQRTRGKIILIVEGATSEKDIVDHNYKTQYKPKSFLATLKTFQARYGIDVNYIPDTSYTGHYIYTTLIYQLRELLVKGVI